MENEPKKKKFVDADLIAAIVCGIIFILYAIFVFTGGFDKLSIKLKNILPIESTEWVNPGPFPTTESPWK